MKGILDLITDALNLVDYPAAHSLLQQLQLQEPDHPWIPFYSVFLEEIEGEQDTAYQKYLLLLKEITNPKILSKIRQRLTNIEANRKQLQQFTLNQTRNNSHQPGILVLESIKPENKVQAVQQFAEIMQIDPYTARLQLPSRYWRLYRTGFLDDLQCYTKALKQAQIPAFCVGLEAINKIQVYSVEFIQIETPQPTIQYLTEQGTSETFSFDWSDVRQIIRGMVPLVREMTEFKWKLLKVKTDKKISRTTDYIKICDLHLKQHNFILRFVENTYQYSHGISLLDESVTHKTIRESWQKLMRLFEQRCPNVSIWSDFNSFAETAMDFGLILEQIQCPKISTGSKDTLWENTFHLYSGLAFLRS